MALAMLDVEGRVAPVAEDNGRCAANTPGRAGKKDVVQMNKLVHNARKLIPASVNNQNKDK